VLELRPELEMLARATTQLSQQLGRLESLQQETLVEAMKPSPELMELQLETLGLLMPSAEEQISSLLTGLPRQPTSSPDSDS
jgi:hypothetical protein